jgi:hypothetical protein
VSSLFCARRAGFPKFVALAVFAAGVSRPGPFVKTDVTKIHECQGRIISRTYGLARSAQTAVGLSGAGIPACEPAFQPVLRLKGGCGHDWLPYGLNYAELRVQNLSGIGLPIARQIIITTPRALLAIQNICAKPLWPPDRAGSAKAVSIHS